MLLKKDKHPEKKPILKSKRRLFSFIFIPFLSLFAGLAFGLYQHFYTSQSDIDRMNKLTVELITVYGQAQLSTKSLKDTASTSNTNTWVNLFTQTTNLWSQADNLSQQLETLAGKISQTKSISYQFISSVQATSSNQILAYFDAAPAGKKIQTLAKILGVETKQAYQIFKAASESDATNWENTAKRLETMENVARGIKGVSKVSLYVGGLALSGGATSTIGTILGEAGAIFGGADLVLEIGEDSAKIALGYNSKAAAMFEGIRKISEPTATIFSFANISTATSFDKLSTVMFAADQINSALQENKYAGISVDFKSMAVTIDGLDQPAAQNWLQDKGISQTPDSPNTIITDLSKSIEITPTSTPTSNKVVQPSGQNNSSGCSFLGKWKLIVDNAADGSVNEIDSNTQIYMEFLPDGVLKSTATINGESATATGTYYSDGCVGGVVSHTDNADNKLEIKDGKLYQHIEVMGTGLSHKWIYEKVI